MVIGTNSDGLNGKRDSLNKTIEEIAPSVLMIQETKFSSKGRFKAKNYEIFEQIRTQKGGGGLLTAVHEDLSPVLVGDALDSHPVHPSTLYTMLASVLNVTTTLSDKERVASRPHPQLQSPSPPAGGQTPTRG